MTNTQTEIDRACEFFLCAAKNSSSSKRKRKLSLLASHSSADLGCQVGTGLGVPPPLLSWVAGWVPGGAPPYVGPWGLGGFPRSNRSLNSLVHA